MSVAGDAFNLHTDSFELFQILTDLFVSFPIREAIHLHVSDAMIVIQYQAELVFEIGPVNNEVSCTLTTNLETGRPL